MTLKEIEILADTYAVEAAYEYNCLIENSIQCGDPYEEEAEYDIYQTVYEQKLKELLEEYNIKGGE